MVHDPTTAAIARQIAERDRLRAEVDRLVKAVDAEFENGYDQAVREIRDHFTKTGQREVVIEIERTWSLAFH